MKNIDVQRWSQCVFENRKTAWNRCEECDEKVMQASQVSQSVSWIHDKAKNNSQCVSERKSILRSMCLLDAEMFLSAKVLFWVKWSKLQTHVCFCFEACKMWLIVMSCEGESLCKSNVFVQMLSKSIQKWCSLCVQSFQKCDGQITQI